MPEDQAQGEDLYSDNMGDAPPPGEDKSKTEGDAEDESRGDEQEAILPRSILAGKEFNVGDELTLKVTAIRDGEISVKYATGKSEDEPAEPEEDGKAEIPATAKDSLYD